MISNYVALLQQKVNKKFVAICHIKLFQHTQDYEVNIEKENVNLGEVIECYHIGGDYDYLFKVIFSEMSSFREFMVYKLTSINHIGSTHKMLSSRK